LKPEYRLLALDLDGTLLNEEMRIEPRTAGKLAELSARGVEIILCSGRRFSAAVGYAKKLDLPGPIVVNNGALAKEAATGRTLYAGYFPQEQLPPLLRLLREMGLPAVLLTDRYPDYDFYVDVLEDGNEYHREYVRINRDMARVVEDLAAVRCEKVTQVDVFHAHPRLLAAEERIAEAMKGKVSSVIITHVKYKGCSLEFAAPGSSKWQALRWLAEQRGIQPEEIVAIGDDVNDVEMVRAAGYGVAVANALDEVKAVADYVTSHPNNLGVEEAVGLLFP
jgi:Cof subfamily protein (haloacid dehalogenase superfamily)